MDVVTHTVAGAIIASPMFSTSPLTAGCFVLGSVLPDADSLGRVFGKAPFIRWHQTYTHSLPVIVVLTMLIWPLPDGSESMRCGRRWPLERECSSTH